MRTFRIPSELAEGPDVRAVTLSSRRRDALTGALLCVIFASLFGSGCATTAPLTEVIEKPIPQPAVLEIGEIPDPPPITTAALPEDATDRDALRAIAEDFRAAREWGWSLYHKLINIKRANAVLKGETGGDPETD